jgi:hypothetical protein
MINYNGYTINCDYKDCEQKYSIVSSDCNDYEDVEEFIENYLEWKVDGYNTYCPKCKIQKEKDDFNSYLDEN